MDLRRQLLKEHSKENSVLITEYISNSHEAFEELMSIFINEEYRLVQRAAWPIGMLGNTKSDWFTPYYPALLECLKNPKHNAVSRNIYRTLQDITIPEEFEGSFYDQCLTDLSNPKSATAIKVFGMTVAFNIAQSYPEMHEELALTIEEQIPYTTIGYSSRARKLLKILRK